MDTHVAAEINAAEAEFVTEADWVPAFWNFLAGLDRDDLIAELVQNDLDQGATRTVISFEQDCLVCEGNGKPVDAQGWQRLRKIQGAGLTVPAKRGKIGVKNHGLKTAFTIGDEINLLSGGQSITQTLYCHGRRKPPFPAASAAPKAHPEAPLAGCRIVVRYRRMNLEPREGEAIVLGVVGEKEIESVFRSACVNIPEQFAGIVSPEVAPRYDIIMRHWRLGEAQFQFSCTRPRKATKDIELFHRRCEVKGSAPALPSGLREQAARRSLSLRGRLKDRVPDFFRRGNRFLVEVSWRVDRRGKPMTAAGRFRYPIGYAASSHEAHTGHGLFYNAPIVSDTERHGPARNDATNDELREACSRLAIDALSRCAVPRWGPDGLNPLVPDASLQDADSAVRPLLAEFACRNAIPTLAWDKAVPLLVKDSGHDAPHALMRLHRRDRTAESRNYGFAIPVLSWKANAIYAPLAVLCPRNERQLDPRVHPEIIRLLADMETDGFDKLFITFDDGDGLTRAAGNGNSYFDACRNPERDFADLLVARSCLDLIDEAIDQKSWEAETEAALQAGLLLPDSNDRAMAFKDLHTSAPLPSAIPGLRVPPILHKDIASHSLFRRKRWRRPAYTMGRFLEGDSLRSADRQTRKQFWNWLCRNERYVPHRDRATLAVLPIWPDSSGHSCTLAELCEPKSRRAATILGGSIRRPHESVGRSKLAASRETGRSRIRSLPSQAEISAWLEGRMASLATGAIGDTDTTAALGRFETEIAVLLKHAPIARLLKSLHADLPALAQDGSIARRRDLVMPGTHTSRLALPKRFLLARGAYAVALDGLSAPLPEPTMPMLLAASKEDSGNFAALQARLNAFLGLSKPGDAFRSELASLPILPVHGAPHAPRDLAFTGPQGDYWGDWKSRISAKGLSQDDQRRYLAVGVTSATPSPETSRAFLEWLSKQDATVIQQHMTCVLRHILHRNGPGSWASVFTDVPFIPARGRDGVRLVSLSTAFRRPVYLPDFRELADAITEKDSAILLVIDRLREVSEPVSESLRALGVRSLREAIGEPTNVAGSGTIAEAPAAFRDRFEALRSSRFRRTFLKRLDELGVAAALVWRDWQDRLAKVKSVRCADEVTARYRFHGETYALPADAGFDPGSATFWIKQRRGRGVSSIYEAIAAQFVFKAAARPLHFLALERALMLEIRDPSFGRPGAGGAAVPDEKAGEGDAEQAEGGQPTGDDAELGEAIFGHSPFEPDPGRNIPQPRPLPAGSAPTPAHPQSRARGNDANNATQDSKPTPELEREHIEALKKDHYASHCQMCLCERSPRELAPAGSYVEWEEVRRRVVEAHHVDLKSGGGARHAGNLILLCKLHHDNYGRRLTRAAVTAALRGQAEQSVVRFGDGDDLPTEVRGRKLELVIPDTGEVVSLFFTEQHAAYYLSQA